MDEWSTQTASDIIRDGLGVELLDTRDNIAAEVFRCDRDRTVCVTCWSDLVTQDVLDWLLPTAFDHLAGFEDGSPLPPVSEWPIVRP